MKSFIIIYMLIATLGFAQTDSIYIKKDIKDSLNRESKTKLSFGIGFSVYNKHSSEIYKNYSVEYSVIGDNFAIGFGLNMYHTQTRSFFPSLSFSGLYNLNFSLKRSSIEFYIGPGFEFGYFPFSLTGLVKGEYDLTKSISFGIGYKHSISLIKNSAESSLGILKFNFSFNFY